MAILTRKQREIAQREEMILDVAREMLVRDGYLGLKMDQIAERLEYSKGTIYQHFPNKEEIILALANQAMNTRSDLFAQAVTLRKTSRERVAAVGAAAELFVERYPHFFQIEQLIRLNSISEKTTENRRNVMRSCESKCLAIVGGVVRDAIAQGDLQLPEGAVPEDIVFGLWATHVGSFAILSSGESLQEIGIQDAIASLHRNQNRMLDGYQWQPLSTVHDFEKTIAEVRQELMASD